MRLVSALIFTACSSLLSHQATWAHGPAPAVLGPPAGAHAGTDVIRLASGLAARDELGTWRYMCPATWGGPGAPLVISDDQGVWVLGSDGPKLWTGAWSTPSELSSRSVLEFTNLAGRAWALTRLEDQAELISLDSTSRYSLSEPFTELIATGVRSEGSVERGFALARAESGVVSVLWLDQTGQELSRWSRSLNDELSEEVGEEAGEELIGLDLRSLEGHLYLELTLTERSVLMSLDALIDGAPVPGPSLGAIEASAQAVSSHDPIVGPISWSDTRLIMSGGEIYTWSEGGLQSWSDRQFTSALDLKWTCLTAFHLCTAQEVFALPRSAGEPLTQLFAHAQLKAPLEEHISPERWPLCQTEWFDYAVHAGINPSLARSDEQPSLYTEDSGGAAAGMGCDARQSDLKVRSTSDPAVIILGFMMLTLLKRCARSSRSTFLNSTEGAR